MQQISEKIDSIKSKEDFVGFVQLLLFDLRDNPSSWENKDIESYIDAIARWTEDMDGYYANNNIEIPVKIEWKIFANILVAASVYE